LTDLHLGQFIHLFYITLPLGTPYEKEAPMPKVKLNPIFEEIRGQVGNNLVLRRTYEGNLSLMKKPDMSKVEWSEAQAAHRQRFKEAVAYAHAAMADPRVRAIYEQASAEKRKRAFHLAISDYFHGRNLLSE
jgi:hypothetical protein